MIAKVPGQLSFCFAGGVEKSMMTTRQETSEPAAMSSRVKQVVVATRALRGARHLTDRKSRCQHHEDEYIPRRGPRLCCHLTVTGKVLQLVLIWTIYKGDLRCFVPETEHHRIALPSFLIDPPRRITNSSTPVDAEERCSTVCNGDQLV